MNADLPERLAERLAQPLAGVADDARFASGRPGPRAGEIPSGARPAAVLALLYPSGGQWHLPLTLRPRHLPDHGGQISLPGGAVEPGESSRAAALRELHEELGAADAEPAILGRLSPIYVQVSNFRVAPFVGACRRRPDFRPNPAEVEELLEIPLSHLLDPANLSRHERLHQGKTYRAPHFSWRGHKIWGATCLILGELLTIIESIAAASAEDQADPAP
ncbi:MAG: CoA pyrophosphatase [Pirellulales bacterium]|jgi:8-oxo-dGTP pyrophosphatase MutT (NUDIX family)|nr:CoA pyrophosphatase [Thermoguttaceae bacterium]MDD4786023.1 CoA pyrophosphatase [Pirellulales bacterium]NLY99713.1 CoA pyrophosphatase [Pirellulaceae bacterium]